MFPAGNVLCLTNDHVLNFWHDNLCKPNDAKTGAYAFYFIFNCLSNSIAVLTVRFPNHSLYEVDWERFISNLGLPSVMNVPKFVCYNLLCTPIGPHDLARYPSLFTLTLLGIDEPAPFFHS